MVEASDLMPHTTTPNSLGSLGEFGLIEQLKRQLRPRSPQVLRGIGDDAALLHHHPSTHHLVVTTDLFVEGIDFLRHLSPWRDIGYKATVANISDIAAMGAAPRFMLVGLAIPGNMTPQNIRHLYQGMQQASRPYQIDIVGGDLSASPSGLTIAITLFGGVEPGLALTRDGAKVGDLIYISGTLGDAKAGLDLLLKRSDDPRWKKLIHRHRRPTARVELGRLLSRRKVASAAIDVSDGLSGDLQHVCTASGVGAVLQELALPISSGCRRYAKSRHQQATELALAGGEDYELLFTIHPRDRSRLARIAKAVDCPLTCIGTIVPRARGLILETRDGTHRPLVTTSYRHFS
jgi:thiamine-monophosphate kinase